MEHAGTPRTKSNDNSEIKKLIYIIYYKKELKRMKLCVVRALAPHGKSAVKFSVHQ